MTAMRLVVAASLLVPALVPALAAADSFGGFSGVDRPYLVTPDRVCTPLKVTGGAATGQPTCEKAAADVLAKLSIKDPIPQRGTKAAFTATAQGTTLTVARKTGEPVVVWKTTDPIAKVVEVYASQYEDRIAVAYNVRRMGKEVTDIVGFDLGQSQTGVKPTDPSLTPPNGKDPSAVPTPPPTPADPKLTKALADARKAPKAKAMAAWKAVLALDASNAEATYRIAALQATAIQTADALAKLVALSSSKSADAIEWLIEARWDPAFAALRADPKFRAAVGLDRAAGTAPSAYERLMGFGGQWEQTGTSCDKPEVKLNIARDRTFKLRVKTTCQGQVYDTPFKGTWRIDASGIVLTFPTKGKATSADEAPCKFEPIGDEDSLRCTIGRDLEFVVLPTRR